jgi:hypothetical protein
MPKYAMHNDPKVRKKKYDAKKISGPGHNARGMEKREMSSSIAGGSARPSGKRDKNGKFLRGDLHAGSSVADAEAGISIFDPTLCEIIYRWFTAQDAFILDPFAGGSVRGIVAAELNRNYVGIDLREEQIEANRAQAEKICKKIKPLWHAGNSKNVSKLIQDQKFDFIFSCPPYLDLEVYSDNPEDLSTMPPPQFFEEYNEIIKNCCALLKEDRFACFVVGDVRDKKGNYLNFVSKTIEAFLAAGLKLYNEAILITAVGSLPIRAGRIFSSTRKLGKTHQNVLVFLKGDSKRAAKSCGSVEVDESMLKGDVESIDLMGMDTNSG